MRSRCTNLRDKKYADYGGRGIGVCVRWLSFKNFLDDMGTKPTARHTIERKKQRRPLHAHELRMGDAQSADAQQA
jgi:hypothetical protein